MAARSYDESELEAAVARLEQGDRLQAAEANVAAAAPALQRVLAGAMAAGGWFGESHRAELERIATIEDPAERAQAMDLIIAEEARIAMMVGAAVGWALAAELGEAAEPAAADSERATEPKES